jgi:glutamine amidotransferase
MNEVVVIDYGLGNLLSVIRAFERLGVSARVGSEPDQILRATHIVLPGVGAFPKGMEKLKVRNLDLTIKRVAESGKPLLGICLGMQLLLDDSEEFTKTKGLGLIPGNVVSIPTKDISGAKLTVPHVGWNSLCNPNETRSWENSILSRYTGKHNVYFVHSYMAVPKMSFNTLAVSYYGGHEIVAAISKDNIIGCQFHPEKSGEVGLKILESFLQMK